MAKTAEAALDELLAAWPSQVDQQGSWLSMVGTAPTRGPLRRGNRDTDTAPTQAIFAVLDESFPADYATHRAVLRKAKGGWRLCSLKAICGSCLGEGMLPHEGTICDVCGGEGWGVAAPQRGRTPRTPSPPAAEGMSERVPVG